MTLNKYIKAGPKYLGNIKQKPSLIHPNSFMLINKIA